MPRTRLQALEEANRAKRDAERVRAQIRQAGPRAGALQAAEIVAAGESSMRAERLLQAVPRLGARTVSRMLEIANVDRGGQRIREISPLRRDDLVRELLHHANQRWRDA